MGIVHPLGIRGEQSERAWREQCCAERGWEVRENTMGITQAAAWERALSGPALRLFRVEGCVCSVWAPGCSCPCSGAVLPAWVLPWGWKAAEGNHSGAIGATWGCSSLGMVQGIPAQWGLLLQRQYL